ncbi:MAG TPA: fatty acid desaturase family protein, partial [Desertimonas sp.]|nr:fatty acid desaturase family protein [Desertimonas sp.]
MTATLHRDYGLLGPEGAVADGEGLVGAVWYKAPVPRARMKQLMQRSNGPAIRDTLLWFALLAVFGGVGAWAFVAGNLVWIPLLAVYGVLYGSVSDSRWHEAGHRTAFKTPWMNDVVYQIACFMIMRSPTVWRWSHTRHHTDTLIVGRDPEILAMRPPAIGRIALNFFGLVDVPRAMWQMVVHASGRLTDEEQTYVPAPERRRVHREARVWIVIYAVVIILAAVTWSILPLLLVGGPRLYGAWLHLVFGLTQHAGLAEDVLDHRLDARTIYMNPVFRFLYWNMNYHVEHHMFPLVPFHSL